jgi:hypothetical protein
MSMTHARSTRSQAFAAGATALASLIATIEASPIQVSARSARRASRAAPSGFDRTDTEILDWIASHRRGSYRRFILH